VDVTIVAGRPRIGALLGSMRSAIALVLGLAEDAVSVKASTGNLSGDVGAGRAISAEAVATVVRLGGGT
jgi:2C-methyl-D-erythritol 2,4-cyclodiphosphate synthase